MSGKLKSDCVKESKEVYLRGEWSLRSNDQKRGLKIKMWAW